MAIGSLLLGLGLPESPLFDSVCSTSSTEGITPCVRAGSVYLCQRSSSAKTTVASRLDRTCVNVYGDACVAAVLDKKMEGSNPKEELFVSAV